MKRKEMIINEKNFEERAEMLNRIQEADELAMERAGKSPYRNFVQLNRKNIIHILKAGSENKQAVRVLFFIIAKMGNLNTLVCPYSTFKKHLGISQATVNRSITYLQEKGFIQIKKNGRANKYIVNDELAWKNRGSRLRYCEYKGSVLSAATEEEVKKFARIKLDPTAGE